MFQIESRQNVYAMYVSDKETNALENIVPVLGNNTKGSFMSMTPLRGNSTYSVHMVNGGLYSKMFSHPFNFSYDIQPFSFTQTNIETLVNSNISYYDANAKLGYSADAPIKSIVMFHKINYIHEVVHIYPFGVGKGNILAFLSRYSVFFSAYLSDFSHSHSYTSLESMKLNQTIATPDTIPPVLRSVTVTPFGAYSMLYTIRVADDFSGVYKIKVSTFDGSITSAALVSGDIMDGVYQFLVNLENVGVQLNDYGFTILDHAQNKYYFGSTSLLPAGDFQYLPKLQRQMDWIPSDFTHFEFEKRDCYVTNKSVDNHLYFNVTNADTSFKPKLLLKPRDLKNYFGVDNLFEGAWDRSRDMYNIPFTVPKNLFQGPLRYELITAMLLPSQSIAAQVGFNATLEITSEYADLLGPLITNVSSFIDPTSFGWDIEIEDFPNGLASGQINVSSNYNPVPIVLDVNNLLVTGDKYKGVYRVSLPIPKQGRSDQIFTFTAYLKDTTFNVAEAGFANERIYNFNVHPFFKIFNTLSEAELKLHVPMPGYTDNDPPYLTSLTATPEIDVGLMDRTVTVSFTVTDDGSGVNAKNNPHVYISTLYDEHVGAEAFSVDFKGDTILQASYSCNITLPYGFGHFDQLFISVYGMFDNNLNTNGYSSLDLKSSFQYKINRKYSS
eukprot:gene12978-15254_t